MASRYFTQFFYSFFKKPVLIAGSISLAANASVSGSSIKGVSSVSKTGTGEYTVTLSDEYYALFFASAAVSDSTEDIAVSVDAVSLSSKTFKVVTKVAGSAANVTDDCTVYVQLVLSNTSV